MAAGVVVLALGTWAGTRSQPAEPDNTPANVIRSKNAVDLPWYAGGRLHLADVSVALPAVTSLAAVAGGAVYGDVTGEVGFVAADGSLSLLGSKLAAAPVVVSGENSWTAWIDGGGDGTELVLYDLAADEVLGRLNVEPGSHPIAVDQHRVYFSTPDGDYSWAPGSDAEPLERNGLLDVDSATRVYGGPGRIEMVQSFFSVSFGVPAPAPSSRPAAAYVLTRQPGSSDDEPFAPVLYDARSGQRLPLGLDPDELAIDAAFGPNYTVSYLVIRTVGVDHERHLDGNARPLVVLRTCDLGSADCHDIIPLARAGEQPLLAH